MSVGVRISDELYKLAQKEGSKNSRSASKQIEYWAKLAVFVEKSEFFEQIRKQYLQNEEI